MDTTQHPVDQIANDIYERSLIDMKDEWDSAVEMRDDVEYDPDLDEDDNEDGDYADVLDAVTAAAHWLHDQITSHYDVSDEAVCNRLWELINDGLT